ncbi:MAG: CHASE2 domain-containing protein [Roseiarcus sp.]
MRVGRPPAAAVLTSGFAVFGLLWGGFLGVRQMAGVGSVLDRFENLTLDWRFLLAGAQPAPRGVVIAAIDDETVREAGAYPLPRSVLARIVRGVAAFNPQAIALDIAFVDAGQPEADSELAEALRSTKSVVAAIGVFEGAEAPDDRSPSDPLALVPSPTNILWPTAEIRGAAISGLVNVATDAEGIPRYLPMIYRSGDGVVRSFALAAASAALNTEPVLGVGALKLAARSISMDLGYHLPIRYYGPRGSIRQFSAARVLRGDLDPDDVRGQVVVLGATAVGVGDTFATPFDRIAPGVEVVATGVTNLLAGDGLVRTALVRRIDAGAAMALPCVTVLLMAMRRAFAGLGLASLVFVFWGAFAFVAFLEGYWLSFAVPLAACAPVAIGYGAARLGLDRTVADRLAADRTRLAKFQSPLLVEHILKTPRFLERPVLQDVAVVFLDLSNFTGVAESLGPQWARDLLAEFQALIERDVLARDGFVVSFMGDGAMIVFGLPQPRPDDASRAFLAIMRLRATMVSWLGGLPPAARDRLGARIGGHFGPAVVSLLGPAHHQHIAATGDTVNVASRLLEVAKERRCVVVVSENLRVAANAPESLLDNAAVVDLEVNVRGRVQPLRVRTWG